MASEIEAFRSTSTSRLKALYSDFSKQKRSNPASYQANVAWWKTTLETIVWKGLQSPQSERETPEIMDSRLLLNASEALLDSLRVNKVGKPIGLDSVIVCGISSVEYKLSRGFLAKIELTQTRNSAGAPSLIPLTNFLSTPTSIYTSSFSLTGLLASYLIKRPLLWSLEQLGITGDDGFIPFTDASGAWYGEYVMTSLVEKVAEKIINRATSSNSSLTPAIYSTYTFRKFFASCLSESDGSAESIMSEKDAKILLRFLQRDKRVIITKDDAIKFVDDGSTEEITPIDIGILEVKSAISSLEGQINDLQSRIEKANKDALEAVKQKRKPLAIAHLRSSKRLQPLLEKRINSLGNLQDTLLSIESAAGDVVILNTFKSSTATLRTILSHPLLQRDSIEQTMDALAEANAEAKEIDNVVKISGDVALDVEEDAEIQDELNELIKEAETERKVASEVEVDAVGDALSRLPSAPHEEPVPAQKAVPLA